MTVALYNFRDVVVVVIRDTKVKYKDIFELYFLLYDNSKRNFLSLVVVGDLVFKLAMGKKSKSIIIMFIVIVNTLSSR